MNHPDRMEELAAQLRQEWHEGMAQDRLDAEHRTPLWEIEGWDNDVLRLYIAGSGLHLIPADEVNRLASALTSEFEIYCRTEGEQCHRS